MTIKTSFKYKERKEEKYLNILWKFNVDTIKFLYPRLAYFNN